MAVTIGADVETFVKKGRNIVSSIGLIGGSKEHPLLVDGGNLQEDNVLAEFAINPANSEDEFVHNINLVMQSLRGKLVQEKFSFAIKSSHVMSDKWLDCPQAMQFGCDPDWDAWEGFPNFPPQPDEVGNLRTAGGHIHLGYDDSSGLPKAMGIVKWMDVLLGVPSVLLDGDKQRRKMYGKAGAFRKKEYGVEYRTLSNFWISSEERMRWAYRQSVEALHRAAEVGVEAIVDQHHIVSTINNGDKRAAAKLVKQFDIALPS